MAEPRVPEAKLAEARALWEIALIYIALGTAARVIASAGSPQQAASAGYVASSLLARAYYRLIRAAWTGFTFADRGEGSGEMTSLMELFEDFETLAFRAIPRSKHADTRSRMAQAARGDNTALDGLIPEGDEDSLPEGRFPVDERGEPVIDADFRRDRSDERGWPIVRDIIVEALKDDDRSSKEMADTLRELDKRLADARKAERRREQEAARKAREGTSRRGREDSAARRRSAARTERAAATMKAAQSGARDTVNSLAGADHRAIGWVRVPHHPTPCGWCLMLASRGIVLYKSAASARSAWHENCHCTAEPVFSRDHYFTSPQFAKNRALNMLWRDHGFGKGKQGERDFGNYFRRAYHRGVDLRTVLRENAKQHRTTPSQEDI